VVVLGHQASGVLDGHAVPSKGHHAGTEFEVQGVQGRREQGLVCRHGALKAFKKKALHRNTCCGGCPFCPLYLSDSPGARFELALRFAPSVDAKRWLERGTSLQRGNVCCQTGVSPFA
jgi:hypothetical protein